MLKDQMIKKCFKGNVIDLVYLWDTYLLECFKDGVFKLCCEVCQK